MHPDESLTNRLAMLIDRELDALPLAWPDASNWCWKSRGLSPELIKLARTGIESPFWRGIWQLFGFDRWQHARMLPRVAGMLPPDLPLLPVPLTFLAYLQQAPVWSLPWRQAEQARWTEQFAEQLGHQIGLLHRETADWFGHPLSGRHSLDLWPTRVRKFLQQADAQALQALADIPLASPKRATWCLPDLRADQFLESATDGFWSDWEALVMAPIEFDWTLLELLLVNSSLRQSFCRAYQRYGAIPDIESYRLHHRGILCCLEVFGPMSWPLMRDQPVWLNT
ncbi:hypothetical protein [Kushneria phosphatilytica]|uniref:Uncharacterized protein n=1 Tax=Kushneria phosphatilytica TaxID=657387 RepID=A0A1S1NWT5_9GAMM|nr:hypothetical protein [Kushneria phosphatilytica]OHV11897.1 hypothetical protein BH688_04230 [Kushneria phosphatilytica]QEL11072.1 hypothetical protein FY550_07980 [Kushneria phosphatilytica]